MMEARCLQAGVAWVILDVAIKPVLNPSSFAASRIEPTG